MLILCSKFFWSSCNHLDNLKRNNSPSQLWKEVKPKSQSSGMVLKEKGVIVTDEKELAEIINPFFKEKIQKIASEIPEPNISRVWQNRMFCL